MKRKGKTKKHKKTRKEWITTTKELDNGSDVVAMKCVNCKRCCDMNKLEDTANLQIDRIL